MMTDSKGLAPSRCLSRSGVGQVNVDEEDVDSGGGCIDMGDINGSLLLMALVLLLVLGAELAFLGSLAVLELLLLELPWLRFDGALRPKTQDALARTHLWQELEPSKTRHLSFCVRHLSQDNLRDSEGLSPELFDVAFDVIVIV